MSGKSNFSDEFKRDALARSLNAGIRYRRFRNRLGQPAFAVCVEAAAR